MEEFEVKFLDINLEEVENKLVSIGAEKAGETLSRITNFDYPDLRLKDGKNAWVRVRSEFSKTTLTYKQRLGVTSQDGSTKDAGMKEIEVVVDDFDKTKDILLSIGLIEKFSQERKRIKYTKNHVEFCIDTWPLVPTYLEIEGPSWEEVRRMSDELGFDWDTHFIGSFGQVCEKYGFGDHDYKVLTFKEQIKK